MNKVKPYLKAVVGFIAQQAASKAILANAGYDQIAEQYNPFDPGGLAVSTLVPAAC